MIRNAVALMVFLLLPVLVLAETVTYVCNYPTYSAEDGSHKVKAEFALTFLIDLDSGKGYMIGNNGSEEMHVLFGDEHISFIEITASNNVMSTAITNSGVSVHSRNTVLSGDLVPSQYYGTCEQR